MEIRHARAHACVCGVCMPVYKYVWKGGGMGLRTEQQGLLTEEMQ